jgi:hypothetical protein
MGIIKEANKGLWYPETNYCGKSFIYTYNQRDKWKKLCYPHSLRIRIARELFSSGKKSARDKVPIK